MRTLVKMPFRLMWRITRPLRRPFARKIEALVVRSCALRQQPFVCQASGPHICHVSEETSQLMDHLVREVVRLQAKVERLQYAIEDLSTVGPIIVPPLQSETRRVAG